MLFLLFKRTTKKVIAVSEKKPLSRSELMARVGSHNTSPELAFRKAIHAAGLRFRLHVKSLPGSPDVVLPSRKIAIFIHGCFWHQHDGCKRSTVPKENEGFWKEKFSKNLARDERAKLALEDLGWEHITVWECEVKSLLAVESITKRLLASPKRK